MSSPLIYDVHLPSIIGNEENKICLWVYKNHKTKHQVTGKAVQAGYNS